MQAHTHAQLVPVGRYLPHLCHLKRPACQERQRLSSTRTPDLSIPFFFLLFWSHTTGSQLSSQFFCLTSSKVYICLTKWPTTSCSKLCECVDIRVCLRRDQKMTWPLLTPVIAFSLRSANNTAPACRYAKMLWICKWIYANQLRLFSNVRRSFTGRDSQAGLWDTNIWAWNTHICLEFVFIALCHMNTNVKVLAEQWCTCV